MDNNALFSKPDYRGRFAPSPTGPLHFGSMVSAVGSYLQARHLGGTWLVRIEDLDPPREQPGAADAILTTLRAFAMDWDEEVVYQSQRTKLYHDALQRLASNGASYPCACSRKTLQQLGMAIYPGTCRGGLPRGKTTRATRLCVAEQTIQFRDAIQGDYAQAIAREVGDFIIQRADGQTAYQLAVVVDDAEQGITEVVRGADLLDNTPRQIYLQDILHVARPSYAHLPVAHNKRGEKLSKQSRARPVDTADRGLTLIKILEFLGQQPLPELSGAPLHELWDWAIKHWRIDRVPRVNHRVHN